MSNPICGYCQKESKKVTGKEIYPHRQDLWFKVFYQCKDCDAYVGCHPGTEIPLGDIANKPIRRARLNAHRSFDAVWQSKKMTRKEAYSWLRCMMGLNKDKAHIGMMNQEQCEKIVELSKQLLREVKNV